MWLLEAFVGQYTSFETCTSDMQDKVRHAEVAVEGSKLCEVVVFGE